jgi:phosphotransferase family enzyme
MTTEDPLAAFIARSLRAEVSDVRSEVVAKDARRELERIRFRQDGEDRSLVVKRMPPNDALETQLLPFLSRKSDRVPNLRSRGIPPPAVPAWPWVLIEDLLDTRSACEADPRAIIRAKATVERAVAGDAPALRALGVPSVTPVELVERAASRQGTGGGGLVAARTAATALAALPQVLCHGDLTCTNARLTDRGVVLDEWAKAHIGCGLLDVARLAADLGARGDRGESAALFGLYGDLVGIAVDADAVRAAEAVDRAVREANT